jgi:hypothetical protein
MPIPDERLPQVDDSEDALDSAPEMLDEENDELEFETADADSADDQLVDPEESEPDTAGFGYGDPAD